MIDYRKLGLISKKQHTIFKINNELIQEHIITREGFSDLYSILYQKQSPTQELNSTQFNANNPHFPEIKIVENEFLHRKHFQSQNIKKTGNTLQTRTTLLINQSCSVGIATQNKSDDFFYLNSDADELYYVSSGQGILQTVMGEIDYKEGDYLFIPKGIAARFLTNTENHMLVIEGKQQFGIPKHFKNTQGQISLDAPYNHRDFKGPDRLLNLEKLNQKSIIIKKNNKLTKHDFKEFPFQIIGWDGWYWPFSFSIFDYQPKTSSVHLPPTIHTVFSGHKFCIMNFVPRMLDYHPNAIPCPWPHSSVDCDEVIFYARGNFTSRKNISKHSISFHPSGVPHGPHPQKYEESIGQTKTEELGIMIDTFEPLSITEAAVKIEDLSYFKSWV